MTAGSSGFGIVLLTALLMVPPLARADDKKAAPKPTIMVENTWFASIPNGGPTYGYFKIENQTQEARLITGFSSPECSSLKLEEAHSGMSGSKDAVTMTLAAKTTLVFSRGGYHLVCTHGDKPFSIGQIIPVTISINGGTIGPIDFKFRNFPTQPKG